MTKRFAHLLSRQLAKGRYPLCECGGRATNYFAGYECARCMERRHVYEAKVQFRPTQARVRWDMVLMDSERRENRVEYCYVRDAIARLEAWLERRMGEMEREEKGARMVEDMSVGMGGEL